MIVDKQLYIKNYQYFYYQERIRLGKHFQDQEISYSSEANDKSSLVSTNDDLLVKFKEQINRTINH